MSDAKRIDPRVQAFCSMQGFDVFHSVSHRHDIWKQDLYDVESIHAEARGAFEQLVDQATTSSGLTHGKTLLVLGESGSGKTHLMRSFRNYVHSGKLGYCGYMQMTTQTDNYGHYILSNLIDSLDQPYSEPGLESSGLMYLSNTLVESKGILSSEQVMQLREGAHNDQALGEYVCQLVDRLTSDVQYRDLDLDLMRALMFLQRDDPRIKGRVLKYLRCEYLPDFDWKVLGGVLTRENTSNPQRMVENLGRTMQAVHAQQAALVLLIDQLEDIYNLDDADKNFRRAMDTIRQISDNVPSSIVVISCLEDVYVTKKKHLTRSVIDRLEHEPKPVDLKNQRSLKDIRHIVAKRLGNLYDMAEVAIEDEHSTFPFTELQLKELVNLTTRKVINWCREYREQCIHQGQLIATMAQPVADVSPAHQNITKLEHAWSLYQSEYRHEILDDDDKLIRLLAWALEQCVKEIASDHTIQTTPEGWLMGIEILAPDNTRQQLMLGLCNKRSQGGGLMRQINQLDQRAGKALPVIVRTTEFPRTRTSAVSKRIGDLISTKSARRVLAEDSDWRTMAAFRDFIQKHQQDEIFAEWRCVEKPLTQLKTPQKILGFDEWLKDAAKSVQEPTSRPTLPVLSAVPETEKQQPNVNSVVCQPGEISVGIEIGLQSKVVTLVRETLTKHVAFLGSSGSGKTTVALNIIEQLLLGGIPVVLIDRKGDLCRYADPAWWDEVLPDPIQQGRKEQLRQQIDVHLYTPVHPEGRPLGFSVIPDNLSELNEFERHRVVEHAANGLAAMMGYQKTNSDKARIVILSKAISLLANSTSPKPSLKQLIEIISEPDAALVSEVGYLDSKNFKKLSQDLNMLLHSHRFLVSSETEPLCIDTLLGKGNRMTPGKTRLSIISTKFLNDNSKIEFWVSRLLVDFGRWINRNPTETLQAVLMLDEADLYLPAQRKPATKEPMENLIKRARSAGLGLFLATQNPGDFDYKFRENIFTWFIGKISERNSVKKVEPMFELSNINVATKLPNQGTGEFHLLQAGHVKALKCGRSLMETKQLAENEILSLASKSVEIEPRVLRRG